MRIATTIIILLFSVIVSSCNNDSGTSSAPGGQDPNGFTALLSATFAHPRCQNCHGFNEGNAAQAAHENRPTNCSQCHSTTDWHAPFKSFSFTGLSSNEICVAIKNKFGGDIGGLSAHMKSSPLLWWGIEPIPPMRAPGGGAPPGDIATWNAWVDQWVTNGANCT